MRLEELVERARRALDKPSRFGYDIDVHRFLSIEPSPSGIEQALTKARSVGIDDSRISLLAVQLNRRIELLKALHPGVEAMPLEQAIDERWDEIKDYLWRAIEVDRDRYTAAVQLYGSGGLYVRIKRGTRVELPLQLCFMLTGGAQLVHSIVVVEPKSEVTIVTGCSIMTEALGLHVGVTEIFVEEEAKVVDIMVHSWTRTAHARPRTGVVLGDDDRYVGYYINLSSVETVQGEFTVNAKGDRASAKLVAILLGLERSTHDIYDEAKLIGEESSAEVLSRVVARDSSRIVTRAYIEGASRRSRGYIECNALLLSPTATVTTVPSLEAKSMDSELHHEASIGRLREEEIEYLIMRGFTEREAISILIRGFLEVDTEELPQHIAKSVEHVLDIVAQRSVA